MKKIITQCCLILFFFQTQVAAQQQSINEEKVNKGVVLMKKMIQNPGEVMTLQAELQALKLNSAEDKEVRNRMEKSASEIISKGKQQAMQTGGVTQQQIDKQKENQDQIMPVKDVARINAVLKRTLTENELKKFCKIVHEAVKKQMQPEMIAQAEKFYLQIKKTSGTVTGLGNGAISCYLTNLTHQSIYIMGRVCSEENLDANNINNYAALLTNHGVEEGAISLLNYLQKKFGKDPVIYSNLAMAWLGLGDLKTAEKFADSCIRYFPDRSHQAHYVKCIVEESNGNRQGAVEQLQKSIGQVYSAVKESQLRKWGGKAESKYHKRHFPADALGLSKFNYPTFPMNSADVLALSEEWRGFYNEMDWMIKEHQAKEKGLNEAVNQSTQQMAQQMIEKVKTARTKPGYFFAADNNQNMGWRNLFNALSIEYASKEQEYDRELEEIRKRDSVLKDRMHKRVGELSEKYENTCGEGQDCPSEEICNAHKRVYDEYLGEINAMLDAFYQKFVSFKRRSINELVYAAKYSLPEAEYERFKNERQLNFLRTLRNVSYRVWDIFPDFGGEKYACMKGKPNPFKSKGLQRFEDIHCPPDWSLEIATGTGVSTHCTKITLKLGIDLKVISASVSRTEDLLTGEWTNTTIELGTKIGTKTVVGTEENPIIKAHAGAAAFIEIDRQGITDWGVKGKAGIGNDAISARGEVKISVMSGKPSFSAKSQLKGAGKEITTIIFKN
jgi:tetratricopeptide (TPR) repeat protein